MKRSPKWPRVSVGPASRFAEGSATARRKSPAFPARKPLPAVTLRGDAAAEAICAVVRRIPRGWVATYGQVATMAGMPRRARLVGRVLQCLEPTTNVPWHRVVNAKGEISPRSAGDSHELQRMLLEAEGVKFDEKGRILRRYFIGIANSE